MHSNQLDLLGRNRGQNKKKEKEDKMRRMKLKKKTKGGKIHQNYEVWSPFANFIQR